MADANLEELKKAAAQTASELVTDGMVVGDWAPARPPSTLVDIIGARVAKGLDILAIPTSEATRVQALGLGIRIIDFSERQRLDICIDGADEIGRGTLDLIKGGGGALLREKIVAAASDRMVVISDSTKVRDRIGGGFPLPVEIVPFGWEVTFKKLQDRTPNAKVRPAKDGKRSLSDRWRALHRRLPVRNDRRCRRARTRSRHDRRCRRKRIVRRHRQGMHHRRSQRCVSAAAWVNPLAARILIVMGVSGSGKSTVARELAREFGWQFAEGDDFHSSANIEKMRSGQPLNDDDRLPWLGAIAGWIDQRLKAGEPAVVTCSALKHAYRDLLSGGKPDVLFVYLKGTKAAIEEHMAKRTGHFMPASLLPSQFEALEEPTADENFIAVDLSHPIPAIVAEIAAFLGVETQPNRPVT